MNAAAREGGGRGGRRGVRIDVRERMSREVCVERFTFDDGVWVECEEGSGSRRDLWLSSRSGLMDSGRRRVNRREVKKVKSRGTRGLLLVWGLEEIDACCWPERSAKAVVMQRRDSRVVCDWEFEFVVREGK